MSRNTIAAFAIVATLTGGILFFPSSYCRAAPPDQISSLHPRIFVRADSATIGAGLKVSEFRDRGSDPAYSAWSDLSGGEANWEGILTTAARYLMLGGASDLQTVRNWLVGQTTAGGGTVTELRQPGNMAAAFDWCYAGLSAADRTTIMNNIKTWADGAVAFLASGGPDINHNYTYMAVRSIALAGLALKGEAGFDSVAAGYLNTADLWLEGPGRALEATQAKQGTWVEGNHYNFMESARHLILTCAAYKTASNRDYFRIVRTSYGDFFTDTAKFYIYNMRPDFTWERIGDMSQYKALPHNEIRHAIEALCLHLPDPNVGAMLHSFSDTLGQYCGTKAVHRYYKWGMMMFYDATAPLVPSYTSLPLAVRMGSNTFEQVVFRSGWGEESTVVTFLSGNHFVDHQHFDKGHFQIYHKGGVTADAGAYDSMYSNHHKNYATRTVAHNSLLVYDPAESFGTGYVNDGGQRVIRGAQHHETWDEYVAHLASEYLDAADLESFDYDSVGNVYSYARGNLTGAYRSKVTHCDRQLLYLNSRDFLVVFDRVSSSDPTFEKSWLLHTMETPVVDGTTPSAGVMLFPGASGFRADRTASQDIGAKVVNYSGRIFCKILLPESRVLRTIGGSGYEYYVRGTNYEPSSNAGPPREPGNWRVEVSPSAQSLDDQFLHVFQITDTPTAAMVAVSLVRDGGGKAVGVKIDATSEEQFVIFNSNQLGGSMSLPLSYDVNTSGLSRHVICELAPNITFTMISGGRAQTVTSSAAGVLSFLDRETGPHSLEIRTGPVADFTASPTSGEAPLIVQFTDQSVGDITSWLWDFGDSGTSTQQNPEHTYMAAGAYTVSLTVTGPGGVDIEAKSNYITVTSTLAARFSATPTTGPAPLAVRFTDESVGRITSWSWTFGDGGTSTQQNPQHTYASGGAYTVGLTVSGPEGTASESKTNYIKVGPLPPTGVAASDGTYPDKIQVTWNSAAGATQYRVYRNTSDSSATATALGSWQIATQFDDTTAAEGIVYYYWAKARNDYAESGFSSFDTGYRKDTSPPGVSNLYPAPSATAVEPDAVISVRVSDALSGVNANTLRMWVGGELVYDGSQENAVGGDPDQWQYEVPGIGTGRRQGSPQSSYLVFDAEPDFNWGSLVAVDLDVYDNAGNHSTATWNFWTAARWFGPNARVSDQTAAARKQSSSRMALDSTGRIYVVWEQTAAAGDTDIYLARSTDGGQSFGSPLAVAASGANQKKPAIAVGPAGLIFVVWQDDGSGTWDIHGAVSADGQTWNARVISAETGNQEKPSIAWDSAANICVIWEDDRYAALPSSQGIDVLGATSTDGVNWTPITVTSSDGDQTAPRITVDTDEDPDRMWAVWEDTRGAAGKDVYGAYSNNGGASWTEVAMLLATADQQEPDVAAGDGKWRIAYSGTETADGTYGAFYLQSGMVNAVKVDGSPLGTNQTAPALALAGSAERTLVVWVDDTRDAGDILFSEASTENVPTFGLSAVVNDDGTGNLQSEPHLTPTDEDGILVSMTDSRSGVNNIYLASSGPCVLAHQQVVRAHQDTWIEVSVGKPLASMRVHIPADTFRVDTLIKIYEIEGPPATPKGEFGPVVRIGPSGPGLAKQVTVTIPHPSSTQHATDKYYAHRYSFADSAWKQNDDISGVRHYDLGAGVHGVEFTTGHFSMFCASATSGGGGGGGGCFVRRVGGLLPGDKGNALLNLAAIVALSLLATWITRRLARRARTAAWQTPGTERSWMRAAPRIMAWVFLMYCILHGMPLP